MGDRSGIKSYDQRLRGSGFGLDTLSVGAHPFVGLTGKPLDYSQSVELPMTSDEGRFR